MDSWRSLQRAKPDTNIWLFWDGVGYDSEDDDNLVYYTEAWIDFGVASVQRELARALQRDGVLDSYSEAKSFIETAIVTRTRVGDDSANDALSVLNDEDETIFGNPGEEAVPATIVELRTHDE